MERRGKKNETKEEETKYEGETNNKSRKKRYQIKKIVTLNT